MTNSTWPRGTITRGLAAERARYNLGSGDPSRVLWWLPDLLDELDFTRVVIYGRASTIGQVTSIPQQLSELLAAVDFYGLTIVGRFKEECSGAWYGRSRLGQAIVAANLRDAFVLADNSTRILRHENFHSRLRPSLRASDSQWDDLKCFAGPVRIATIADPALANSAIRSGEIRRGHSYSGNQGGRPAKSESRQCKEEREAKLPTALKLFEEGLSKRAIAASIGVPKSTVHDWITKTR
jgi:hypothetical protein